MGAHKGREGQGARTAFRKAPQASPPETRFTVEVNDFLERFKLLELGLPRTGERADTTTRDAALARSQPAARRCYTPYAKKRSSYLIPADTKASIRSAKKRVGMT